jgi:ferredoxin/(2Fe-2S) ferredoxin
MHHKTDSASIGVPVEDVRGKHVFVCCHGERDCRCGNTGTALYDALTKLTEDGVTVHKCSHIGGHQYAANAIVYPQNVWYGNLQPQDAPRLLESVDRGDVLEEHYRGKMNDRLETKPTPLSTSVDITFKRMDGSLVQAQGKVGERLLDVAHKYRLPLEGVCGGNMECATCHVIVDPEHLVRLPPKSEAEQDMLDYAPGYTQHSRLACQIQLSQEMNRLLVSVPFE